MGGGETGLRLDKRVEDLVGSAMGVVDQSGWFARWVSICCLAVRLVYTTLLTL